MSIKFIKYIEDDKKEAYEKAYNLFVDKVKERLEDPNNEYIHKVDRALDKIRKRCKIELDDYLEIVKEVIKQYPETYRDIDDVIEANGWKHDYIQTNHGSVHYVGKDVK